MCRDRKKAAVIKGLYQISTSAVAISYRGVIQVWVVTLVRVKV